jgi:hypothetical protein
MRRKNLILTLAVAMLTATSSAYAATDTYPKDLDLSNAPEAQIVKVAAADARDLWERAKEKNVTLDGWDVSEYSAGRAIKHGLSGINEMRYENAFREVMEQLKIDGE